MNLNDLEILFAQERTAKLLERESQRVSVEKNLRCRVTAFTSQHFGEFTVKLCGR